MVGPPFAGVVVQSSVAAVFLAERGVVLEVHLAAWDSVCQQNVLHLVVHGYTRFRRHLQYRHHAQQMKLTKVRDSQHSRDTGIVA